MTSRIPYLVAAAVALGAAPSSAQAPVSPFHSGEWGAHIAVDGLTFTTVDVLHFTAPTRAWVLSFGAGATAQTFAEQGFPSSSATHHFVGLNLSVQRRFFRTVAPHASVYLSPGISGGGSHQCDVSTPASPRVCTDEWQLGALVEVGGEYLVGSHVGVGVRYSATVNYFHLSATGGGADFHEFSGDLRNAGVFVSLFF